MVEHGLCGPAEEEFINVLGNGDANFTMPYDEALQHVIALEEQDPVKYKGWSIWVRRLPKSHKFYTMQGAYVMTDKFKVFNQKTGTHEEFTTLEEAIVRRQELLNQFVVDNPHMFSINREIIVNGGPDTMWAPITDLPPPAAI